MTSLYRMPVVFGPTAGPRYAPPGVTYAGTTSPKRRTAYIRLLTDAAALERWLPAGFSVRGTPMVSVEHTSLTEIDWLAGRGYSMLALKFPVFFQQEQRRIAGWFQPVIWENMTDPIISGREELGFNKIFAQLPPERVSQASHVWTAEWEGFRFLEITLEDLQPAAMQTDAPLHLFHHRYMPAAGVLGRPESDHIVVTPAGNREMTIIQHHRATGRLNWGEPEWRDMPTQYQIVQALRGIPTRGMHSAGVLTAHGGKDLSDQCRVEDLPDS